MDPKAELLVFNKKEILVIIILLVLVACFSFTLGLKLGKTLGASAKAPETEHAPLAENKAPAEHGHDAEPSHHDETPAPEATASVDAKQHAEDQADAEFAKETDKENVGAGKPVPMAFPKNKKGEGAGAVKFTLQVGAHRTVAEATEQVGALKRRGLDAFYLEAQIPGKGTWYRVGLGLFSTKEQAEAAAEKWKSKNLPSYIIQKIGE